MGGAHSLSQWARSVEPQWRPRALIEMARRPTADVEAIERLEAENERLRAAIKEAQAAIEQHKIKGGPGSVDFDGILARLRDALGRRL